MQLYTSLFIINKPKKIETTFSIQAMLYKLFWRIMKNLPFVNNRQAFLCAIQWN
jgi:hypothetical protein